MYSVRAMDLVKMGGFDLQELDQGGRQGVGKGEGKAVSRDSTWNDVWCFSKLIKTNADRGG